MVDFDLWIESAIFGSIYSVIIIIPCVLVALFGRKMIEKLGQFPTKTPVIQMSIFWKLLLIETFTFAALISFYFVFSN